MKMLSSILDLMDRINPVQAHSREMPQYTEDEKKEIRRLMRKHGTDTILPYVPGEQMMFERNGQRVKLK